MPPLTITLTAQPLEFTPPEWCDEFGAEISFHGVVRGTEGSEPISGIEYTAYEKMVDERARRLGTLSKSRFVAHRARIVHRIGFVPVAQPSVLLHVGSAHSESALEICRWYLSELKQSIPIWKRFLPEPQKR